MFVARQKDIDTEKASQVTILAKLTGGRPRELNVSLQENGFLSRGQHGKTGWRGKGTRGQGLSRGGGERPASYWSKEPGFWGHGGC